MNVGDAVRKKAKRGNPAGAVIGRVVALLPDRRVRVGKSGVYSEWPMKDLEVMPEVPVSAVGPWSIAVQGWRSFLLALALPCDTPGCGHALRKHMFTFDGLRAGGLRSHGCGVVTDGQGCACERAVELG